MKALVVDDDFTNRLLLQRFLSELGEVHIAVDGEEAVEAVRLALSTREPYELILLDINMPQLDGQQSLRIIRELEDSYGLTGSHHSKVVMTTAMGDKDNVMAAFRGQADAYLLKPVQKPRLLETVRGWGLA
jgi:two-component system chemotaxis response regulator CheY